MINPVFFSVHSLFTAIVIFTFGACVCCFKEVRGSWKSSGVWGVFIGLLLLRVLLPLQIPNAYIISIKTMLPNLYRWTKTFLWKDISIKMVLLIVWGIGLLFTLVRLSISLYHQAKLIRKIHPIEDLRITVLYEQVRKSLSCVVCGNVGVCCGVETAMMVGFFRPHIAIPIQYLDFSDENLEFILQHEVMHFLRHDTWKKLGMEVFCCLFWWNPVIYFLRSSISRFLEIQCDRKVCGHLSDEQQCAYAGTLLYSHERGDAARKYYFAQNYIGRLSDRQWKQRIKQIVTPPSTPKRTWVTPLSILLIVLLFIASYGVVIQPATPASSSPIENQLDVDESEWLTSFILSYEDGKLIVYKNNREYGIITSEELMQEPYSSLPILVAQVSKEVQ